ncbi:hypothetical protein AYI69_g902 [Smittium culicis]|uniref:Uncharacterized protein n=1 Tax=Smittium culicis TaxID=133412 RepID=A0A1R1YS30_9FUNG|nr:hypothetical protein AYI69_g902 [Smittium culicis]
MSTPQLYLCGSSPPNSTFSSTMSRYENIDSRTLSMLAHASSLSCSSSTTFFPPIYFYGNQLLSNSSVC